MSKGASNTAHVPVMPREVLAMLGAAAGGVFLDCTLGGAGHTRAILEAHKDNEVVAIDRDKEALERSAAYLDAAGLADRVELKHAAFSELLSVCGARKFNGMLADLGLSTDQLHALRGFSFAEDCELDMRMDQTQTLSAATIVNETSEIDLFKTLKRGGVGREAHAVARAIVRARPVKTTRELAEVIAGAARGLSGKKKIHPATVSFQALRMAVNGELEQIEELLAAAPALVMEGGRLAVITFHSLEDKMVTRRMRDWEGAGSAPAWWPGAQQGESLGFMVERKAMEPAAEEIEANPSARSARLRVFEFSAKGKRSAGKRP